MVLHVSTEDLFFTLCNCYGYNNSPQNKDLMTTFCILIDEMKILYPKSNIVDGEDFNVTQVNGRTCGHDIHSNTSHDFWKILSLKDHRGLIEIIAS